MFLSNRGYSETFIYVHCWRGAKERTLAPVRLGLPWPKLGLMCRRCIKNQNNVNLEYICLNFILTLSTQLLNSYHQNRRPFGNYSKFHALFPKLKINN